MHKLSCWSLSTLLKSIKLNLDPMIESCADWMSFTFQKLELKNFPTSAAMVRHP